MGKDAKGIVGHTYGKRWKWKLKIKKKNKEFPFPGVWTTEKILRKNEF